MKKNVFKSIMIVTFIILLVTMALTIRFAYSYFEKEEIRQMTEESDVLASAVENEGMAFLEENETRTVRVTWIAADGHVLYDTQADPAKMENHKDREEVKEAIEKGHGDSARFSGTLSKRYIYAASTLEDGSVMRVSKVFKGPASMAGSLTLPLLLVILIAAFLASALSSLESKKIIKPLNELNLDEPLENEAYDELSPLLRRIGDQQQEIRDKQKMLDDQKEEFDLVTGSMEEGLILLNKRGVVLSINRAAREILSAEGKVTGENILTLSRDPDLQKIVDAALNGKSDQMKTAIRGHIYEIQASTVKDGDEIRGAALYVRDVTDRENAERIRREFTANVSHELKTPLHSISGAAELLHNGIVKQEDVPAFTGQIYSQTQRLIDLVEDIIKLSKLEERGIEDKTAVQIDLRKLVEKIKSDLSIEADGAGVTVDVTGEAPQFKAPEELVRTILFNLANNGIKYNHPGGHVHMKLAAGEGMQAGKAVATVSDDGIGIPEKDIDRIFERFYRVDKSRSKDAGGTGLGLSIVKHSAELLGAKISLESKEGAGTTVTVEFPL